jgi:hypothetical protein
MNQVIPVLGYAANYTGTLMALAVISLPPAGFQFSIGIDTS